MKNEVMKAVQSVIKLQSVIDDIKKDDTRIIFREKDGREQDLTDIMVPLMEYVVDGLKYIATGEGDGVYKPKKL